MTTITRSRRRGPAAPPGRTARGERRLGGRVGNPGAADKPRGPDTRRPVVLRCPGPLVALRGLAALYGVSAERLATVLPACETHARTDPGQPARALADSVAEALGARPLSPVAVHYFHAAWLRNPRLVLEQGLRPSPITPEAVWHALGELVSDVTRASWASRQPSTDGPHNHLLRAADALDRGPCGCLVQDVLLRPARYGAHDHLKLPALVDDLTAACTPYLGFDLAVRFTQTTTACVVEYRRRATRNGQEIEAALWFVAAGLRGTVSRLAVGGNDAHGIPIPAHDIVSVRAIATQTEWTPENGPR